MAHWVAVYTGESTVKKITLFYLKDIYEWEITYHKIHHFPVLLLVVHFKFNAKSHMRI